MDKKKTAVILSAIILALIVSIGISTKHRNKNEEVKTHKEAVLEDNTQQKTSNAEKITANKGYSRADKVNITKSASIQKDDEYTKTANLYDTIPDGLLPMSAIKELSELPDNIKTSVSNILNASNAIFMIKKNGDKIVIVTENPDNIRHGIDFVEISTTNGHQTRTTLGYNGKIKDSDNDIWEYDKTTKQPLKHSKYNKDGDIEFIETWNYDPDTSIKYEMKDNEDNVLSVRKETVDNGVNLRVENIIYDKEGNTKMNVTTSYEGSELKRFTYYNADKPSVGGAVYSEYSDGVKTKETLYTSDLKVKNSFKSTYTDGIRSEITVYDKDNNEIEKLVSE